MLANILFTKGKNSKSKIYAIDIQDIKPIENVIILKKDINDFLKENNTIEEK